MQRFIRKSPHRRIVRPANRVVVKPILNGEKQEEKNESITVEENNDLNKDKGMNAVEQIKDIVNNGTKTPKRKVKVEKKEKGLLERNEMTEITVTEDNKMLLND